MNSHPSLLSRIIALCLLAVMSFASAASEAGGLVICFGADGHVALEVWQGPGCGPFVARRASPHPPVEQLLQTTNHCGRCFDIALTGPGASLTSAAYDRLWLITPPITEAPSFGPKVIVTIERSRPSSPLSNHSILLSATLRARRVTVIQV